MATMDHVAQLAGVSATTVSHVLNNTRRVSPATRVRVEHAVLKLGYRRNRAASILAGGSSRTIGLSISGLTNPYFGPLVHAIERRISEAGYLLVLGDSHDEATMEQRVIDSLLERQVDGIIVAPTAGFQEGAGRRILEAGTPLVLVDRSADVACDKVTSMNRLPVSELTDHLIAHGHTKIAVVVGLAGLGTTNERLEGYREALSRHGIPVEDRLCLAGESNVEAAEAAVARLLGQPNPPTALIPLNNSMAIGAMRAVKKAGLRIPHDIALAAYDDFEWSDLFEPGLTAIAQNVTLMGREAVDLLLARLDGDESEFEHRVIETSFNRRTSCGCTAPQEQLTTRE